MKVSKVLISIFSSDKNLHLLEPLLNDLNEQIPKLINDLFFVYIVDFSEQEGELLSFIQKYREKTRMNIILVWKPKQGFCQNVNCMFTMARIGLYNYYICLNDDIRISENFLENILKISEMGDQIGFIGGVPQKGGWLETEVRIPEPINKRENITNFSKLQWEFSACILFVKAIRQTGDMDSLFSPQIGLCADNDILLRMSKEGYRVMRDYNCTFWHGKAHSQIEYRDPIQIMKGTDPHSRRARQLFRLKWGIDILEPSINQHIYDKPYNGKPVVIWSNDLIEIDGKKVKLQEV